MQRGKMKRVVHRETVSTLNFNLTTIKLSTKRSRIAIKRNNVGLMSSFLKILMIRFNEREQEKERERKRDESER